MSSGSAETRERIMAATWRLMEERRGEGVRLEDVAQAAVVSRQAVYLHFGSRAELLVATVRYADRTRGLNARLEPVRAATTGVEALEAFVEFWGHYIPDIYGLARALRAARAIDEAAAAAWDDRMAAVRRACQLIIAALARDGQLAPGWAADAAVDLLWSLLSVAVWEDLTLACGWPTDQYVREMRAMLRRTFVCEARAAAPSSRQGD
jgi:AcrR family transcriptional regulator